MSDQRPAGSRRQNSSGDLARPEDAVVAEPVEAPAVGADAAEVDGEFDEATVPGIIVGSEDPAAEESHDHWWDGAEPDAPAEPHGATQTSDAASVDEQ